MIDQLLLWFDLETTGLDEHHDHILEIGWGLSTPSLNWLVEPISYVIDHKVDYESTKVHGPIVRVNDWAVDPYVAKMHEKSRLWQDLIAGPTISLTGAEAAICSVLDTYASTDASVDPDVKYTMAGSGVSQFDMQWVKVLMPELRQRLTYYSIDMGTFERVETMLRGGGFRPSRKSAAHRAVDDIMFSHRLAIRYKQLLLVGADFDRNNP